MRCKLPPEESPAPCAESCEEMKPEKKIIFFGQPAPPRLHQALQSSPRPLNNVWRIRCEAWRDNSQTAAPTAGYAAIITLGKQIFQQVVGHCRFIPAVHSLQSFERRWPEGIELCWAWEKSAALHEIDEGGQKLQILQARFLTWKFSYHLYLVDSFCASDSYMTRNLSNTMHVIPLELSLAMFFHQTIQIPWKKSLLSWASPLTGSFLRPSERKFSLLCCRQRCLRTCRIVSSLSKAALAPL